MKHSRKRDSRLPGIVKTAAACCWTVLFFSQKSLAQQTLPLDSVLTRIERSHPALKAPDARIRELDTYASGTVTLPPPRVSGGFWMTPYNPGRWKEGMGNCSLVSWPDFVLISSPMGSIWTCSSMAGISVYTGSLPGSTPGPPWACYNRRTMG